MSALHAATLRANVVRLTIVWAAINTFIVLALVLPFAATVALRLELSERLVVLGTSGCVLTLGLLAVRACAGTVRHVLREPGYPERYWLDMATTLRRTTVVLLLAVAAAVGTTFYAIAADGAHEEAAAGCAVLADVVFILVLFGSVLGIPTALRRASVVPYFDRAVGEIETFAHGYALARHLGELDTDAFALGMTPLSAFGWNDDLNGETLVWHDADAGLKTVNALLARVQGEDLARADQLNVADDLKRMSHALARAATKGARFCLLLRYCDATNGQEWEVRKGTCF
jgi:hypothetical protein